MAHELSSLASARSPASSAGPEVTARVRMGCVGRNCVCRDATPIRFCGRCTPVQGGSLPGPYKNNSRQKLPTQQVNVVGGPTRLIVCLRQPGCQQFHYGTAFSIPKIGSSCLPSVVCSGTRKSAETPAGDSPERERWEVAATYRRRVMPGNESKPASKLKTCRMPFRSMTDNHLLAIGWRS
jgi:hypothetical protein